MTPRQSVTGTTYPPDWPALARRVKDAAGWRCIRCDHPHDPKAGRTLTVHHADMNPSHSDPAQWWFVLWPLCQRCHLSVQARVDLWRPWVMQPHSEWAKPYVAGWYAWRYEGRSLTRAEVEADLDRLLTLEVTHVLGPPPLEDTYDPAR